MSAYAGWTPAQCLSRLIAIKEELEKQQFDSYFGRTRQQHEWAKAHTTEKKLMLTLAGVSSLDAVELLAKKDYKELSPPERNAIARAQINMRRMLDRTNSLSLGAGV